MDRLKLINIARDHKIPAIGIEKLDLTKNILLDPDTLEEMDIMEKIYSGEYEFFGIQVDNIYKYYKSRYYEDEECNEDLFKGVIHFNLKNTNIKDVVDLNKDKNLIFTRHKYLPYSEEEYIVAAENAKVFKVGHDLYLFCFEDKGIVETIYEIIVKI
jgi:hypothetical protein